MNSSGLQSTEAAWDAALVAREARSRGIDLGLLRDNLRLTPLERIRQHDEAVRQVLATRQRLRVTSDAQA